MVLTEAKVRRLCLQFRRQLLGRRGNPNGQCWAVAAPLCGVLTMRGVLTVLVQGTVHEDGGIVDHWWLEWKPAGLWASGERRTPVIIDPTADQFHSMRGEGKVYVGLQPNFYTAHKPKFLTSKLSPDKDKA